MNHECYFLILPEINIVQAPPSEAARQSLTDDSTSSSAVEAESAGPANETWTQAPAAVDSDPISKQEVPYFPGPLAENGICN